jgi:NAD(P)-dependent dehydrogenase (short-subunit alcohol dehydrogenase family)
VRRFQDNDVPDQSGRTALVTGATGGLGLRVAEVLASRGATVLLGSRNPERGAQALARVSAAATGTQPQLVSLDLADLTSVRGAAADIRSRTGDNLDLLINNGGIMAPPLTFSVDGFESQWATNVIGPYILTRSLLPALGSTPGSRVVFVSSSRHSSAHLDEARIRADIRGENYRGFDYYGKTKLADLLLAQQFQQHFHDAGDETLAVAAHPGFTATGIVGSGFAGLPRILRPIANWGSDALGQPVAKGALPILYAATMPEVYGDDYFGPRWLGGLRGYPARAKRSPASTNAELGRTLVRILDELTDSVSGV